MTTKTLTETLADLRERGREPFRSVYDAMVRRLIEAETAARALKAGDQFPDFALPNAEGEIVRASDLIPHGPIVFGFYRGLWCPYCSAELEALQKAEPDIIANGGKLVAISPEAAGAPLKTKQERGFTFEILSDLDNGLALACGLVFRIPDELIRLYADAGKDFHLIYGNESWFLPMPATYIVRRDGTVAHAYVNPEFRERLDPVDIVARLREIAPAR